MVLNAVVLTNGVIHLTKFSKTREVMVFVAEYKDTFYVCTMFLTDSGMEHDECFDCVNKEEALHYAAVQYE